MERYKDNVITLEQQRSEGLIRQQSQKFVPAVPQATPVKPADFGVIEYNIQTPPTAMTTTETTGTHVHRGLEFLLKTSVLAFALSILTVAVVVVCWNQPVMGGWTLLGFWVVFACVWLYAYILSTANSSEGIARLQAESQCSNLTKVLDARIEDYRERARLERKVFALQNGLEVEE
jgi:hypothetical protein